MDNYKRIAIVGVGGIGSHLMDHVNQLSAAGEFVGWHFTIFDNDIIEPKNLKYQKFSDKHMGMPKAEALYETLLDIPKFDAINRKATVEELSANYDVVVICVDSGKWRREFFEKCAEQENLYWIDLRSEGRIIAAYTKSKSNKTATMVATVQSAKEENASCQLKYELDAGKVQAGNRIVALIGTQYLLNLYHGDSSPHTFSQLF